MLGRVPPLPASIKHGLLYPWPLTAKWRTTGSMDCELGQGYIAFPPAQLEPFILAPTKVTINGNAFCNRIDSSDDDQPNLLAVLVLAWSYILTARLMELQGGDVAMIDYTDNTAPLHDGNDHSSVIVVSVGNLGSRSVRWFEAILASGSGYQVTLRRDLSFGRHAPWAFSLATSGPHFAIQREEGYKKNEGWAYTPLASYEAIQSLRDFSNRSGVSIHQLHAALATALVIPSHEYFGVDVSLPRPTSGGLSESSAKLEAGELDQLFNDLPYFITLSCTNRVIASSLCGVFWNPHVPSNLVGPWLQPLLELEETQFDRNAPGRFAETLAVICARRAPNIAFLCLGATISGLMPEVLSRAMTGKPPLERHAYAWTGVPQSFMDLAGEGPYYETHLAEKYIRRSDCWRLRYLPTNVTDGIHFGDTPMTPWEPPGHGLLKYSPLRVRLHSSCKRHDITYEGATWNWGDGRILAGDMGKNMIIPHTYKDFQPRREPDVEHDLQAPPDAYNASEVATATVFKWVLHQSSYRPPEAAYADPWLSESILSSSSSESATNEPTTATDPVDEKGISPTTSETSILFPWDDSF